MMPKLFRLTMLFVLLAVAGWGVRVVRAQSAESAARAVAWLATAHRNADGGYSSFSQGADQAASDVGGTLDAALAIASTGRVPAPTVDYLSANADALLAYAQGGGGQAGKALLALTALGLDPRSFGGADYVAALTGQLTEDGDYAATTAYNQALAMLGLVAAGEPVDPAAVDWLVAAQAGDGDIAGSWDDGFGTAGNTDATALAAMALLAAGSADAAAAADTALAFLEATQLADGGWGYAPEQALSVNSTALAVQALVAGGRDAAPGIAALLGVQGESGAFQTDFGSGPADDFYATAQTIPAVAGRPYPLVVEPAQAEPTPEPTAEPAATDAPTEPTAEPTPGPTPTPVPLPTPEAEPDPTQLDSRFGLAVAGFVVIALGVIGAGVLAARRS